MVNEITTAGMDLLLRGLTGDLIDFTKIKLGNGHPAGEEATDLANPLMIVEISKAARDADHVTLTGIFKNTEVTDDSGASQIVFPNEDSMAVAPEQTKETALEEVGEAAIEAPVEEAQGATTDDQADSDKTDED